MPKITVLPHHEICPEGTEVELETGSNLCKALLEKGIKIEHACEMSKACTTCHVVVRKGFNGLDEMDDIEADTDVDGNAPMSLRLQHRHRYCRRCRRLL